MQIQATYYLHDLQFNFEANTSRGSLGKTHRIYLVKVFLKDEESYFGLGEAAPLKGLSIDFREDIEEMIGFFCGKAEQLEDPLDVLEDPLINLFPSVKFAFETALNDLFNGGIRSPFFTKNSDFTPIPINGLVWMGDKKVMLERIEEKINAGFKCIKIKVGAINFKEECQLLEHIRNVFSKEQLIIRLDANGSFTQDDVFSKLEKLSRYDIHSIEQPVLPGQWDLMNKVCSSNIIPVALDEELIGYSKEESRTILLKTIKPQYVILKPTLLGGYRETSEWVDLCKKLDIGWWLTSALESNVGLNAIYQMACRLGVTTYQGLGTGMLYENNFSSPLKILKDQIQYDFSESWRLPMLNN